MRWLTNFYDFRSKWTATAAIGIRPTKACLSQPVNFKNAIWTLEERYAIKFRFKLGKNAMRWKLDLMLWPRDQETEFPVKACWFSQTQEGKTEQIHPQTFNDRIFDSTGMIYMHWVPLAWQSTRNTKGFKGVQEEKPWEEAGTLQIGSVAFPRGQCTSPQLHPCHRLFDHDGHQHSSSPSL